MKKYRAKRSVHIHLILSFFFLMPFAVYFMNTEAFEKQPLFFIPLILPFVYLLWIYQNTTYGLNDGKLYYRSGFLKGYIEIELIKEIEQGKTLWNGLKPALSGGGLIIRYGRGKKIYLAPENNQELIADLLTANPDIKTTN
jgi:hypothetical protein